MISQKIVDDIGKLRISLNEIPGDETSKEEDLLNNLNFAVEEVWDYVQECERVRK